MNRTIRMLFRRDPTRDGELNNVAMAGFELLWPDRRPVHFGLGNFCRQSQRILRIEHLVSPTEERAMEWVQFPLHSCEEPMTRLPGVRVRRFVIRRKGNVGRLHLVNGQPTEVTFEIGRDEPRVVDWVGLSRLRDGEELWFDFAVRQIELPTTMPPGADEGRHIEAAPDFANGVAEQPQASNSVP